MEICTYLGERGLGQVVWLKTRPRISLVFSRTDHKLVYLMWQMVGIKTVGKRAADYFTDTVKLLRAEVALLSKIDHAPVVRVLNMNSATTFDCLVIEY